MRLLEIVLLCIAAAIVYGIVHDQVTARVCVEYFTIGHPPVFNTTNPTLLGIGWGIIATWWVGVLLGIPLAIVARAGSRPKRTARSLVPTIARLLAVMAASALVAGVVGWFSAMNGWVYLLDPLASTIPPDRHARFLADASAHSASYFVGIVGGIVIMVRVWRARGRAAREAQVSPNR